MAEQEKCRVCGTEVVVRNMMHGGSAIIRTIFNLNGSEHDRESCLEFQLSAETNIRVKAESERSAAKNNLSAMTAERDAARAENAVLRVRAAKPLLDELADLRRQLATERAEYATINLQLRNEIQLHKATLKALDEAHQSLRHMASEAGKAARE